MANSVPIKSVVINICCLELCKIINVNTKYLSHDKVNKVVF